LITSTTAAIADRYSAKHVVLTTDVAALPHVWADPHRLAQVLANLLDNALRHTPPERKVHVAGSADRDHLTITVADNGEGVDAAHLPHLFERFYRADTARARDGDGGAGIGLAIAKALTEAHGGRITATSRGPGTGSTFTVVVPIRPATGDEAGPSGIGV
jgi:signal transduction histidine kinase